nr:MAG TPA: hypothetical protein [Caudoviricetes sp.]
MNTLDKVKQWFIDRDLENGGRAVFEAYRRVVHKIFEGLNPIKEVNVMNCFKGLNLNICAIISYSDRRYGGIFRYDLVFAVEYLKSISNILGYDFEECFEWREANETRKN